MMLIPSLIAASAFAVCPPCDRLLASGDTTQAIAELRAAVERSPDNARTWGLLGEMLVRTAPSQETDFNARLEAEAALDRAIELSPEDPRWYFAYGLLLRKRGVRVDARRMFDRALQHASNAALDRLALAELYAQKAQILEEQVLDFTGFVPIHQGLGITDPECPGAFCKNFKRPRNFNTTLLALPTADEVKANERAEMLGLFWRAFELAPELAIAARGLIAELARQEDWATFRSVAVRHAAARPRDGWAKVFLAAGYHRTEQVAEAGAALERALALLPESEKALLTSVQEVVRGRFADGLAKLAPDKQQLMWQHVWRRSDPLFLTTENERYLEHITRHALAEIWYGSPLTGERGYATEPGVILIRLGAPRHERRLVRDETNQRTAAYLHSGRSIEELVAQMVRGEIKYLTSTESGGRWVIWTYDLDLPSFVFEKKLASRRMTHALMTQSMRYSESMREAIPSSYQLPGLRDTPHQVARFLGRETPVEADVFVEVPPRPASSPESVGRAGLFFLPRSPQQDVDGFSTPVALEDTATVAVFRIPLHEGEYEYSVEVLAGENRVKTASRGSVMAKRFGEGLAVSDLVLARSVESVREPVEGRRDVGIRAITDGTVSSGQPLALYFEVYNPSAGPEGQVSYEVGLTVTDADERGVLGRVVGGLGRLLRLTDDEDSAEVRWRRTREAGRERYPEWLSLELGNPEPGEFRVTVTIRDLLTEEESVVTLPFAIEG